MISLIALAINQSLDKYSLRIIVKGQAKKLERLNYGENKEIFSIYTTHQIRNKGGISRDIGTYSNKITNKEGKKGRGSRV